MHWLAELLANRQMDLSEDVDGFLQDTIHDILNYFKIDTSVYDIIIGYRADDSYFSYAVDFVSGLIAKETYNAQIKWQLVFYHQHSINPLHNNDPSNS